MHRTKGDMLVRASVLLVCDNELLEYSLSVELLTEHHLEFLSFIGGCTCSSESTHVEMSHYAIMEITCRGSYKFEHVFMVLELKTILTSTHNISFG